MFPFSPPLPLPGAVRFFPSSFFRRRGRATGEILFLGIASLVDFSPLFFKLDSLLREPPFFFPFPGKDYFPPPSPGLDRHFFFFLPDEFSHPLMLVKVFPPFPCCCLLIVSPYEHQGPPLFLKIIRSVDSFFPRVPSLVPRKRPLPVFFSFCPRDLFPSQGSESLSPG